MPRRRTVVIATAAVLLGLGALVTAGIAVLTQTDRGRSFIRGALVPTLAAAIEGQLHVGEIHGSLFTELVIDSLELREPNGSPFLSTGRIRLTYDPRDLLDRRIVLRSVEVNHPVLTMVDYGHDDWSYRRALKKRGPNLPSGAKSSFGQYIVIDTTMVRDGSMTVRLPWVLSDTLKGAKRDSALYFNLHRTDSEIRQEGNRLTRTWRFLHAGIDLGKSRVADPDSAGQHFALQKLDIIWLMPPFSFRNMRASVRKLGDSLWFDDAKFNLTGSVAAGGAKIVWGSGLPVRYDVKLHGDTVAMADVAWVDNSLPTTGAGSVDFSISNDPHDLLVLEYGLRNMDVHSMNSHVRGNMVFGVGGPVLRITDVALDLVPANTDLLRQFNGAPFPYDWQGNLTARIRGRGGPVNRFALDNATFSYADAHVAGAVSNGSAKGVVDIFTPSLAVLRGLDVQLDQLDLRTPRYVNKLFPQIGGIIRGTVRLDSLWFDARFSNADLQHIDGPGDPSRFTGNGHITLLPKGVRFDVDMGAMPLSYTMLARSYPGLPLRGTATGSIKATGTSDDFALSTTLAGDGGELNFVGQVDALEPDYSATGRYHVRGINLRTLFGDPALPATSLTLAGTTRLAGADLASLRGELSSDVESPSRFGEARLQNGSAALAFDAGHVAINTLRIESSAFSLNASGGLGLVAARRDSLQFSLTADSLGGLRQWYAAGDTLPSVLLALSDSARGRLSVRGTLSGSIDATDALGLHVRAVANATGVAAGASQVARAALSIDVADVMRTGVGSATVSFDSAFVGGVHVASATARATLRDGLAERFGMTLRTPADATVTVAGAVSRDPAAVPTSTEHAATVVMIDTFTVRVDTTRAARGHGFLLLAPARFTVGEGGAGRLDSLVLVHSDTGRLSVRGALTAAGELDGSLILDRLPLADIGLLLQAPALRTGRVSAAAAVAGTREHPQFNATLALRDVALGRARLGAFDVRASYDTSNLALDGVLWANDHRALIASAALPLDLALVSGRTRTLDRPLVGRLHTDSVNLSMLQTLFPDVTAASGNLNTDIALTGTWEHPRLRGQVKLDNGSMSLSNLNVRLDRMHADLALAGDTLVVRQLAATSGLAGDSLSLAGRVTFSDPKDPAFDLQVAARNFLAIDKARSASLTVSTTRPVRLTGSTSAALVRGGVRIDRGRVYVQALTQKRSIDLTDDFEVTDTSVVRMDALLPSAPTALVQNLTLDNVLIEVGDDVWLRSPEANIKLGGALRVTRAIGRDGAGATLALSDSLTVQRGTYQLNLGLARPSFEVERGVIRFFGDPDLEPALDISALHTVREVRANSNRQDVRIRVNIGGTLNHLSLGLTSADNPPLPESDMLSYLVTGEPANVLLGARYTEQGATLALRLAGSYLSSRLAGGRFDVVQVEPTAIAPGEAANLRENGLSILAATRVGLGLQVGRNTYLSLSTGFCGLASTSSNSADVLSLFAQGLGVKAERRLKGGLSLALGLEPGSSAQSCGRLGLSRTFQQTPQQFGADLFKSWGW